MLPPGPGTTVVMEPPPVLLVLTMTPRGFNAKYTALEGDEWSMYAYDAVMIVAGAMERAKSTDGAKVIPEMFKATQISGAAGTYKITANGEIDTTVFIGTWGSDGKVQVIRAWTPPKID